MLKTGDKMGFATRLRLRLTVSALAVLGFALLVGPGGAETTTVAAGTPVGWGCRVSAWGQCNAPSGLSGAPGLVSQ